MSLSGLSGLTGLSAIAGISLDNIKPTVQSVTVLADGVTWVVVFSEAVNGYTGFTVSEGGTLTYDSGDGTATITFTGDETVDEEMEPTMSFTPGNITDLAGNAMEAFVDMVVTNNSEVPLPPVADFSGTPLSGDAPLSVVFTDSSSNTPTSWLWEKNDGGGWVNFEGTPTVQNPTEDFEEGTWDVRLTATNAGGSDGETKVDYVAASSAVQSVTASPTVITSDAEIGTVVWSNPSNAASSNDSWATAVMVDNGDQTEYLKAIGYDFSAVPEGANIVGVKLDLEKAQSGSSDAAKDNSVTLVIDGLVSGDDKSNTDAWSTTDAVVTYGGVADLWGAAPTVTQVKASDFGTAFSAKQTTGFFGGVTVRVDAITLTVYYTE